mgnify:FL=1
MQKTHWDPRMKENTLEHLRAANQAGSALFLFLSPGGHGDKNYWAVRNYGSDDPEDSPQWQAVQEFNRAAPQELNLGMMAPFERDGNAYDTPRRQPEATGPKLIKSNEEQNVSYLFRVPKSGSYELRFDLKASYPYKIELLFDRGRKRSSAANVTLKEDSSGEQADKKAATGATQQRYTASFPISDKQNYEEGVLYSVRFVVLEGEVEIKKVSLK